MHIQINTDKNVDGADAFANQIKVIVEGSLIGLANTLHVLKFISAMRIATRLAPATNAALWKHALKVFSP